MSSLLFFQQSVRGESPQPLDDVRSTVDVVDNDAPSSEAPHAPEVNETLTDPDTSNGLTARQVGPYMTPSEQYVPSIGNAGRDLAASVNEQVSSAGTAASREMSGRWGHGTLQVAESIEPVVGDDRPGMDNNYFDVGEVPAQRGMGDMMTPPRQTDDATKASSIASGQANARGAADNPYVAWTQAATGIGG